MIKSISSSSPHMFAAGGSSLPYVSYNPSNPMQGMMRINNSDMEVFDGNSWLKIYSSHTDIGLSGPANEAISWAIERMQEEKTWKQLAEKNEAVKIALENLEQARQQVDLIAKLARDYEQTTS